MNDKMILIVVIITYCLMAARSNILLNKIRNIAKNYKNINVNTEIMKTKNIINGSAAVIFLIGTLSIMFNFVKI